MSDPEQVNEPVQEERAEYLQFIDETTDEALRYLLVLGDAFQMSISITLTVSGLIIEGQTVPAVNAFDFIRERMAEGISRATHGDNVPEDNAKSTMEVVAAVSDRIWAEFQNAVTTPNELDGEQLGKLMADRIPKKTYVTLKDVTIYGTQPGGYALPHWRGRLDHVSGWWPGIT